MKLVAEKNREIEQQNLALEAINTLLETAIKKYQNSPNDEKSREIEQQNLLLEQINEFILDNNQKSLDNIFSIVSHELRTPLVPIKAYAKMILEGKFGPVNSDQISKLNTITKNVTILEKIIESSIDSKKIESGLFLPRIAKHDLNKIFEDAVREFEKEILEKNIKIDIPHDRYFITCDYDLIKRLFEHLIKNAIFAIDKNGIIMLSIEQKDSKTVLKISDNGHGIPQEKIQELFSKLHQVDMSNTREKGGLGIGLYFCKQVSEFHDGQISIASNDGQGTTVTVIIKS
ncbi:MAG: sensor histidine kinase [Nitrososphaeria archaeon]|nr:sensor histidine kinase [Nitrososphaeria archaeon]NDB51935.1 sensor histidine kinase [Nitrosopumilaceae archaeon]NDB87921.1 sensor histidine kinase [Nitrososphaerota archaeon]NDB47097.1 sensor histidine kinase [Nitrososphaeria archaeon]NDB62869.1 sensor histidine kinase [Nitrosopumilaceae archaeon]